MAPHPAISIAWRCWIEGLHEQTKRPSAGALPPHAWGPGVAGRKQAYEFLDPANDYLWIAGLWEPGGDLGPCYTMVTTYASPLMAPIHNRMPAVLSPDEVHGFLGGEAPWDFRPFAGALVVAPCVSPLAKQQKADSEHGLF